MAGWLAGRVVFLHGMAEFRGFFDKWGLASMPIPRNGGQGLGERSVCGRWRGHRSVYALCCVR